MNAGFVESGHFVAYLHNDLYDLFRTVVIHHSPEFQPVRSTARSCSSIPLDFNDSVLAFLDVLSHGDDGLAGPAVVRSTITAKQTRKESETFDSSNPGRKTFSGRKQPCASFVVPPEERNKGNAGQYCSYGETDARDSKPIACNVKQPAYISASSAKLKCVRQSDQDDYGEGRWPEFEHTLTIKRGWSFVNVELGSQSSHLVR